MKRDWKPGDVAMVSTPCCGESRAIRLWSDKWSGPGGSHSDGPEVTARPLVVIDPEDANAVSRLIACLLRHGYEFSRKADLTAALREFATPKPPKPEEPTGLGAVVEDADGALWTRVERGEAETRNPWYPATDPMMQPAEYADIDAVRVLSEGWSE